MAKHIASGKKKTAAKKKASKAAAVIGHNSGEASDKDVKGVAGYIKEREKAQKALESAQGTYRAELKALHEKYSEKLAVTQKTLKREYTRHKVLKSFLAEDHEISDAEYLESQRIRPAFLNSPIGFQFNLDLPERTISESADEGDEGGGDADEGNADNDNADEGDEGQEAAE